MFLTIGKQDAHLQRCCPLPWSATILTATLPGVQKATWRPKIGNENFQPLEGLLTTWEATCNLPDPQKSSGGWEWEAEDVASSAPCQVHYWFLLSWPVPDGAEGSLTMTAGLWFFIGIYIKPAEQGICGSWGGYHQYADPFHQIPLAFLSTKFQHTVEALVCCLEADGSSRANKLTLNLDKTEVHLIQRWLLDCCLALDGVVLPLTEQNCSLID